MNMSNLSEFEPISIPLAIILDKKNRRRKDPNGVNLGCYNGKDFHI
jgi:hypothetical protein